MIIDADNAQILDRDWKHHADGFVCGDVGVFPLDLDSWEVWERVAGRWRPRLGRSIYHSLDEAKAAVDGSNALPQNPPELLGLEHVSLQPQSES